MSLKVNDLILQSSEKQSSQLVDSIQVSKIVCENFGNVVVDANGSLASVYFDFLDSNNQRITTLSNNFIVNLQSTNPTGISEDAEWYLFYQNTILDDTHKTMFTFNPKINSVNLTRIAKSVYENEPYVSKGAYLRIYTSWDFESNNAPTDPNYYKTRLGINSVDFLGIGINL